MVEVLSVPDARLLRFVSEWLKIWLAALCDALVEAPVGAGDVRAGHGAGIEHVGVDARDDGQQEEGEEHVQNPRTGERVPLGVSDAVFCLLVDVFLRSSLEFLDRRHSFVVCVDVDVVVVGDSEC